MGKKLSVLYYYFKSKRSPSHKSRVYIERWQKKKLKKFLAKIAKRIPFYNDYQGKELKDFPMIDKKIFMDHFALLNEKSITEQQAMEFAISCEHSRVFNQKLDNITVGLSSGTSGRRGAFLVSDQESAIWSGYVLSHFLPKGIFDKCKIAFFMRANSNLYEAVGSKRIQFHFFDIFQEIELHCPKLETIQPDVLVGQPSVLLLLAEQKERGKLTICPQKIISVAEVLETRDQERIRTVFGVDIIHQAYQCTEGCLALTCKCGNLHINEDIVYLEKEYIDQSRFVPIVTDFTRKTQPIVRYRLNDILQENNQKCPCGSNFLRIEKIEGREDDIFKFARVDGTGSVDIFPDFIRRCILFSGEIDDYRIVQQSDERLFIYTEATEKQKQDIVAEWRKLARSKNFILPEIMFYPYERNKNKKMKRVERLWR